MYLMFIKSQKIGFALLAIICFNSFVTQQSYAQYYLPENNNWAISTTGINFSNDTISTFSSSMITVEGGTTISDADGNLLFYTNGSSIWSADGSLMPNSNFLDATYSDMHSISQNTAVVPVPAEIGKYYLFTLSGKLRVFLVDMSLNNGAGDLDTNFNLNHVVLADSLTEKLVAIQGCSRTAWIVTKSLENGNFYSFRVDTAGVDTLPVISTAAQNNNVSYAVGLLCPSPNGQWLAVPSYFGLEIMHFDGTNGKISKRHYFQTEPLAFYGLAFSPSGRYLYAIETSIYQYDLESCNPEQSRTLIGIPYIGTDIKLAPNGKIYFRASWTTYGMPNYLGSIEYPDSAGLACHYRDTVTAAILNPSDGNYSSLIQTGLSSTVINPNINSFILNRRYFDTCVCKVPSSGIQLHAANGFNNYLWSDGSSDSFLQIQTSGIYWVKYTTACGVRTDTFKIQASLAPIVLTYNEPTLTCQGGYNFYQWFLNGVEIQGATDSFIITSESGLYTLIAGVGNGCNDTASFQLGTNSLPNPLQQHIKIYPNPSQEWITIDAPSMKFYQIIDVFGHILLEGNSTSIHLKSLNSGCYVLNLYDINKQLIHREKILKLP